MTIRKYGSYGDKFVQYSGLKLIAEATPLSGTYNSYSGMENPQLSPVGATSSLLFSNIPQDFKDLKLVFSSMNNTTGSTASRLKININGDSNATRYYTRAGYQVSGGNTSGASWNSDNTESIYWGYLYGSSTSWSANGELIIPNYASQMISNFRGGYGMWWNMNHSTYPLPYGFQYYNNAAASLPVTSLAISLESNLFFHAACKVSLYGIA